MRAPVLAVIALSFVALTLSAATREEFRPASPDELQLKSAPLAPGAAAVVLDWNQREDDTDRWESQYLRIKVLTEEGRKYGDVEIPYLRWKVALDSVRARVIQPDGTVQEFKGQMFDKTIIRHNGLRYMAKTFTLPDVHAGSIVEYAYRRRWQDADLAFEGIRWAVQRDLPVLHESIWIRPYTGREVDSAFISYVGLPEGKRPAKVGGRYELELENLPPFIGEAYGPPEEELKGRITLLYANTPQPDEFWRRITEYLAGAIEGFIGRTGDVQEKTVGVIAGAADPEAKLHKLYAYAQQIRNATYDDEKTETELRGQRENKSAADVIARQYGTRNEINRTFVALARAAGYDAHIVRISDREERYFNRDLPDWAQIMEEVAVVTVNGKPRFFDPGLPFAPFGMLAWQNSGVAGLRIDSKKAGTWIETPDQATTDAAIRRNADLHFDGDVIKGKVVATFNGLEALHRRLLCRNDDETVAQKTLQDDAKKWFPEGTSVRVTKVSALRGSDEPLVVEYDVELPTVGSTTGTRRLAPMSIFHTTETNPFVSENRKLPICFPYEYTSDETVTLHLPDGYHLEGVPGGWRLDFGAVAFEMRYGQKTGEVTLTRSMAVKSTMINRQYYDTVRDFFVKKVSADRDSIVMRKVGGASS